MNVQNEATALDWGRIIAVALVVALAGGMIGFGLGVWQAPNVRTDLQPFAGPETDTRSEYYRGVYDACVSFVTSVFGVDEDTARKYCVEKIQKFAATGWYETESPEYVAPGPYVNPSVPSAPTEPE